MNSLMRYKVQILTEDISTFITFVSSRMNPGVCKVWIATEHFATFIKFVRFLPSLQGMNCDWRPSDIHYICKVSLWYESSCVVQVVTYDWRPCHSHCICKFFFSSVNDQMSYKILIMTDDFATFITFERCFSSMTSMTTCKVQFWITEFATYITNKSFLSSVDCLIHSKGWGSIKGFATFFTFVRE